MPFTQIITVAREMAPTVCQDEGTCPLLEQEDEVIRAGGGGQVGPQRKTRVLLSEEGGLDPGQARTTDVLCSLTYPNAGYLGTVGTQRSNWEQGISPHLCASIEPPRILYVHLYVCMHFIQVTSREVESRCTFIAHSFCAFSLLTSSLGYKVVEMSVPLYLCSSESGLLFLDTWEIWGPYEDFTPETWPAMHGSLGAARSGKWE